MEELTGERCRKKYFLASGKKTPRGNGRVSLPSARGARRKRAPTKRQGDSTNLIVKTMDVEKGPSIAKERSGFRRGLKKR